MKYYKMIDNNTIIGAISSDNFIRYLALNDCFLRCDETIGEYISYNGTLYRSTWMKPIKFHQEYVELLVIEITEEEYNILNTAIQNNEIITILEEEEEEPEIEELPTIEIEFLRLSKLNEMSKTCRKVIENGFDLEVRNIIKHFSLNTQDQLNLMSLNTMVLNQSMIPYHADGEEVMLYTAEEIQEIIDTANAFKIYHTTYYNSLKTYINSLSTIEEISAIEYGTSIPNEYKSDVLKMLEV